MSKNIIQVVCCSREEKREIDDYAKTQGLSTSSLLRSFAIQKIKLEKARKNDRDE